IGRAPSALSMVRVTSARPRAGRPAVPAKMTSSILPPRRLLAPCSPRTQAMASTTLDFPEPLGPTTAVIPGSRRRVVAEAKDLKPFSVRLERCTRKSYGPRGGPSAGARREPASGEGQRGPSGERRLGVVAGQAEQLVGDGGLALGAQLFQFLLQTTHLGPQDCVLLGYSELRGGDDVTEQGLGHGNNGLSTACGDDLRPV